MSVAEMTIGAFVAKILRTENAKGKKWLEEHIKALGRRRWGEYAHHPITSESLTCIVYGFCARVTMEIRKMSDCGQELFYARNFLEEIRLKALEYNIEPTRDSLSAIIAPKH